MTAFTCNTGVDVSTISDGYIPMCIYTITHIASGRVYVGQTTKQARKRWIAHCAPSNWGKRGVSGAFLKYGKESFRFDVIDTAENIEQLNHKERFWIAKLDTMAPRGFNLEHGGNYRKGVTDETRKLQREARARWLANYSDRSSLGNGARGRKRRPEEVAAIVAGLIGRPVSEETRKLMSEKQKGVPKSPEYTLRMARSRMNGHFLLRSDGVIFQSYMEASNAMLLAKSAIFHAVNGKSKSSGGYTWKLVKEVSSDSICS